MCKIFNILFLLSFLGCATMPPYTIPEYCPNPIIHQVQSYDHLDRGFWLCSFMYKDSPCLYEYSELKGLGGEINLFVSCGKGVEIGE